jgi:hypothetical protein
LTCQWFYRDNCWKKSLEEIMECVPDSSIRGTLSADRKTCLFPDGTVIEIDLPPDLNNGTFSFEVVRSDASCLSVVWDFTPVSSEISLKTASGTFTYSEDEATVRIKCHNGKRYSTGDKSSLTECLDSPGIIDPYGVFGENITVGIVGPAGAEVVMIDCI